jgi:hypothetical protein
MRTPTCLILAAILSAGCQGGHYGSKDDPHEAAIKVPSIDKSYELVGNGKPPLSLIVTTGGWVKVVDLTAGELIHTAQIPAVNGGLVVQLDPEKKAITYRNTSEKTELPEIILPIDPTHTFELYYQR